GLEGGTGLASNRRPRRRTGCPSYGPAALFPRAHPDHAAPAGACRSGPATTDDIRARGICGSDGRPHDEKKDHRVHKQRRDDPFPISILPPRHLQPRKLSLFYFSSFGVVAMIFTPAPRATSIAEITSEYLTAGSPLTKMIFSGRGS